VIAGGLVGIETLVDVYSEWSTDKLQGCVIGDKQQDDGNTHVQTVMVVRNRHVRITFRRRTTERRSAREETCQPGSGADQPVVRFDLNKGQDQRQAVHMNSFNQEALMSSDDSGFDSLNSNNAWRRM